MHFCTGIRAREESRGTGYTRWAPPFLGQVGAVDGLCAYPQSSWYFCPHQLLIRPSDCAFSSHPKGL